MVCSQKYFSYTKTRDVVILTKLLSLAALEAIECIMISLWKQDNHDTHLNKTNFSETSYNTTNIKLVL